MSIPLVYPHGPHPSQRRMRINRKPRPWPFVETFTLSLSALCVAGRGRGREGNDSICNEGAMDVRFFHWQVHILLYTPPPQKALLR
jgi:hypothetical protein